MACLFNYCIDGGLRNAVLSPQCGDDGKLRPQTGKYGLYLRGNGFSNIRKQVDVKNFAKSVCHDMIFINFVYD